MHRCPVCNTVTESWGWAGGPGRIGVLKVCPRCGWRGWVETQIGQDLPVRDDHDPPTGEKCPKCHGSGRVIILAAKPAEEGDR